MFEKAGEVFVGGLNWGLFRDSVEMVIYTIGNKQYSIPSVGIFDQILQAIVNTCIGTGDMAGTALGRSMDASALFYSKGLFYYLGMMDFFIAILFGLIAFENGPNFISLFINKIFKYGFWMFVFLNWRDLITRIGVSFLQIGVYDRDIDFDFMMHPSDQITLGFDYAIEYVKFIVLHDGLLSDRLALNICIALLAGLFVFISFFLIALNLFLTVAEFYICSAVMLVFIPFALYEKTERFASQTFNLVICFGVRLMILGALIRMGSDFFGSSSGIAEYFVYKDAPHLIQTIFVLGLVFTYAYLCCEAPQMASSVISGSLNLNSNNALMHAYGGAAFTNSVVGSATKVGGAIAGAAQRASDVKNGGGSIFAAARAFNQGLGSGFAQGTMGGLEEGKAVYRASSGRHTGLETVDKNGEPSPQVLVTRDADGNVISGSRNVGKGGSPSNSNGDDKANPASTANSSGNANNNMGDFNRPNLPKPLTTHGPSGNQPHQGDYRP